MANVAPTILSYSRDDFKARIDLVKGFAQRLHIDVCDGSFVPIKTIGLAQVYTVNSIPFDLHLMMNNPESQVETIISLKPELVIAHFEAKADLAKLFFDLKAVHIKVGLAILHDTTIEEVAEVLSKIDHLLIFTGTLGKNGGTFTPEVLSKIAEARAINPQLEIAVDGGINLDAAKQAVEAGVDVIDCGSFIHDSDSPVEAFMSIQNLAGADR